jgi:hypothetical protein
MVPLVSPLEDPKPLLAGVAVAARESPVAACDDVVGDELFVCDASAEWSPAAMKPTSVLPTATLTPAATILPRMLKLRRAMWELCSRQVRVC